MNLTKKLMITKIIIGISILIIVIIFVFPKKCITTKNPDGNMGGGCYYIWQKGWWK